MNEMQGPPDTGFEIRVLAVWGRARYLSVTKAPHNTWVLHVDGEETFLFLSNRRTRNRTPNSSVKGSDANHYPRAPDSNVSIEFRSPSPTIQSFSVVPNHANPDPMIHWKHGTVWTNGKTSQQTRDNGPMLS